MRKLDSLLLNMLEELLYFDHSKKKVQTVKTLSNLFVQTPHPCKVIRKFLHYAEHLPHIRPDGLCRTMGLCMVPTVLL